VRREVDGSGCDGGGAVTEFKGTYFDTAPIDDEMKPIRAFLFLISPAGCPE